MDSGGDRDPFQDDDEDDIRGVEDANVSQPLTQQLKQETQEQPCSRAHLLTSRNLTSPERTPVRLIHQPRDLHSSIDTGHESDDELLPTIPCTAMSSGHVVPSGLIELLNGPEPADMSWSSSMATPHTANATWSHLNTEERKVLLPSGECFDGGKPRVLFTPDVNDTVSCQPLNMTLDAEALSAVKVNMGRSFQTPLDPNKTHYIQPKSLDLNSTSENNMSGEKMASNVDGREILPSNLEKPPGCDVLDLFCSPVCISKNRPKRRRIRCSLVASPNREESDFEQQQSTRMDSPVLSGNIPGHMKSVPIFQEEDGNLQMMADRSSPLSSLEDPAAVRLNPSEISSESTPNRSSSKPSQNSLMSTTVDNMHTTDEFLKDISVTALEQICQAQEKVGSVSTPIRQTDAEISILSKKRLVFDSTSAGVTNTTEVQKAKISTEFTTIEKATDTSKILVEGDVNLDDSFMEQLAGINTTKMSDAVCESSAKSRIQAIKKASMSGANFRYSLQPEQVSHHGITAASPNAVVSEILSVASVLDSGSKLASPKTVLKPTENFIVFSKLREGLGKVAEADDLYDMSAPETNDLQPTPHFRGSDRVVMQHPVGKRDACLNIESLPTPASKGFSTAIGKPTELSNDGLCEGFNRITDTMEEVDCRSSSENTGTNPVVCEERKNSCSENGAREICTDNNVSVLMKDGASALSDTQIAQVADDVQLLLQLMEGEEENAWHESTCSPLKSDAEKVTPLSVSVPIKDCHPNFYGKTTYGFSTAGGKAITVPEEHREKAKLLFHDCEHSEFGSSEHSAVVKKANHPLNSKQESSSRSGEQGKNSLSHEEQLQNRKVSNGFTTASGACIKVSEKSLKRSRLVFEEEDLKMSSAENDALSLIKHVKEAVTHKKVRTENHLEQNSKRGKRLSIPNCVEEKTVCGFVTAGGKKVNVSEKHLEKAKLIFKDLEGDFDHLNQSVLPVSHVKQESRSILKDPKVSNVFSTASGRSIGISEESLIRSRLVFKEENLEMNSSENDALLSVKYVEEAITHRSVRTECSSEKNSTSKKGCSITNPPPSTEEKIMCGFVTAGGEQATGSEEHLDKAKLLIEDIEGNVNLLDKSILPISGMKQESRSILKDPKVSNVFSTASGRSIRISEESLERSRLVFKKEDLEMSSTEENVLSSLKLDREAISRRDMKSDLSSKCKNTCPQVNKINQPESGNIPKHLQGFSTANGKFVPVSEAAINKAKSIFGEGSETLLNLKLKIAEKSSASRSNSIKISDDLLSKNVTFVHNGTLSAISPERETRGESALDSCEKTTEIPNNSKKNDRSLDSLQLRGPVSGFLTASGKSVSVSEQALEKAKNIFEGELSLSSDLCTKTESSNPLTISTPEKELFEISRRSDPNNFDSRHKFSTSSGKSVSVPNAALNKPQHSFVKLSLSNNTMNEVAVPGPCSVATSSTGDMEVKESAVKSHEAHCNAAHEISSKNVESHQIKGFSTASGKTVIVSENALSKAKMLFSDEAVTDKDSEKELDHQRYKKSVGTCQKHPVFKPLCKDNGGQKDFSAAGSNNAEESCTVMYAQGISYEKDCKKNRMYCYDTPEMKVQSDIEPSACFSTGSGKKITVSEENIKRARLLLDEGTSNVDISGVVVEPVSHQKEANMDNLDQKSFTGWKSNTSDQEGKKYQTRGRNSMPEHLFASSITQEVSESTAALLADEELFREMESRNTASFSLTNTITSPSMMTDCTNSQQPIIPEDFPLKRGEPSSPILITSDKRGPRRRLRKGRLSLNSLSTPDQVSFLNNSTPLPLSRESFHCSYDQREHEETALVKSTDKALNCVGEKLTSNPTNTLPLRTPLKVNSTEKLLAVCKSSTHSTSTQSPFRVPYKTSSTTKALPSSKMQSQKRRSSCVASIDHSSTKRVKSAEESVHMYDVFPLWSPDELIDGNERKLRPEVLELRRRSAEEQQRYVSNNGSAKGPRLRPCTGSLLARKSMAMERVTWTQLVGSALPGHYTTEQLESLGVRSSVFYVSSENSALFRFSAWDFYSVDLCRENVCGVPVGDGALLILDDKGEAGVEEVERAFLASPGVDPSLVPCSWVKNHYRWVVWKLAAMERSFPHYFAGRCLTPHILMQQLKYRYDREIDRSQRSALRRILECDDAAAKRMVLCVASVIQPKENKILSGVELELSDGWYSVVTTIDQDLQHRVARGTVKVGTKLLIHGAELLNCSEGCSPLEIRENVRLQIFSNSTRRARWHAKLGFQRNPGPFSITLDSVLSSGGVVGSVRAYVARIYPMVYMEKKEDSRTVVRSQRAEAKEASTSERRRQEMAERVYSDALAEVQQHQKRQSFGRQWCSTKLTASYLSKLTSGEELCELMENAPDPVAIQTMLSSEQQALVAECLRTKQEDLRRDIEAKVQKHLSTNKSGERVVTPILKLRLMDEQHVHHRRSAILSIWRPSEDMASMFKEGQKLTVLGSTASGVRCGELQLSANRSTRYKSHLGTETSEDIQRQLSSFSSLCEPGWIPKFGELDVVGVIIHTGPPPSTDANTTCFQIVYIADKDHCLMGISFWGGMKEYGVEDVLSPRTLIAATNLQWRGGPVMQTVPCVYASELSVFTSSPRQPYIQEAFKELKLAISRDVTSFVESCKEKLEEALSLKNQSAVTSTPNAASVGVRTGLASPGHSTSRITTLTPQVSTPQLVAQMNSALIGKNGPALTGSTFQNLPLNSAQRKLLLDRVAPSKVTPSYSPSVERRLAKLEMYGEPPPISPIVMRQPPKSLTKEFKAPRKIDLASPVVIEQDSPPMSLGDDS